MHQEAVPLWIVSYTFSSCFMQYYLSSFIFFYIYLIYYITILFVSFSLTSGTSNPCLSHTNNVFESLKCLIIIITWISLECSPVKYIYFYITWKFNIVKNDYMCSRYFWICFGNSVIRSYDQIGWRRQCLSIYKHKMVLDSWGFSMKPHHLSILTSIYLIHSNTVIFTYSKCLVHSFYFFWCDLENFYNIFYKYIRFV